jgi:hypothetical protein
MTCKHEPTSLNIVNINLKKQKKRNGNLSANTSNSLVNAMSQVSRLPDLTWFTAKQTTKMFHTRR